METKVGLIELKVDALHTKLDSFVECANNRYADKVKVSEIEKRVNNHETKFAYYAGAMGIIFIIIQLAFKLLTSGA